MERNECLLIQGGGSLKYVTKGRCHLAYMQPPCYNSDIHVQYSWKYWPELNFVAGLQTAVAKLLNLIRDCHIILYAARNINLAVAKVDRQITKL